MGELGVDGGQGLRVAHVGRCVGDVGSSHYEIASEFGSDQYLDERTGGPTQQLGVCLFGGHVVEIAQNVRSSIRGVQIGGLDESTIRICWGPCSYSCANVHGEYLGGQSLQAVGKSGELEHVG